MKNAWLYVFGLILLGMIALGAGPAGAVTSAAGPYYATPSWDQTLPASTRFIVLTNMSSAAVLDRETGLVWEQSPDMGDYTWESAQIHCNRTNKGNRLGWRLPTLQELASLVDTTQANPSLPSGYPFSNVQSDIYWSATTNASNTSNAWDVNFANGNVFISIPKDNFNFVWCVRGGHGVDPQ